jgi:hypothetical protein
MSQGSRICPTDLVAARAAELKRTLTARTSTPTITGVQGHRLPGPGGGQFTRVAKEPADLSRIDVRLE